MLFSIGIRIKNVQQKYKERINTVEIVELNAVDVTMKFTLVKTRDVEAVYLQIASASTPIAFSASAFKQIHRSFASKIRPVRW